jgi:uroporphyrinogen-III synthase
MRLIVTRPEPDAAETAQALAALGHEPILSPMLDIVTDTAWELPNRSFQAMLVTSSNAVRAVSAHPKGRGLTALPLLAVGERTAREAERAGFAAVRSAAGAVGDLAALAAAELDPGAGPLLYAAGEVQAEDLAGRLAALGFHVETLVVYRAEPRERLSDEASRTLREKRVDGVLLYSRRSAEAFRRALRNEGLAPLPREVACFCLSAAIAEPLRAAARGPILIARRPDQSSLFALLADMRPALRSG